MQEPANKIARILTAKTIGTEAIPIIVECQISEGIGIHLVGLADAAVKESLLRIITALQSCGYHLPGGKIVINLAPADLRKNNSGFDLPIAVAIIAASGQEPLPDLDKYVIAGELGLNSSLRNIPGWIQYAELAASNGMACILPQENARLAARALRDDATIYSATCLQNVIHILNGNRPATTALDEYQEAPDDNLADYGHSLWDSINGQQGAKRALEIAAAGGHPVMLIGPPNSNKNTLAQALNDILPPMSKEKSLEVQRIYSVADRRILPGLRPFRAPQYCASTAALLGGGYDESILPGEMSLAHNGVLFFDKCIEAPKALLEGMRGPLEDGKVTITRLRNKVNFPAKFFPVFAANPCPCGYYGEGDRCTCTPSQRAAYFARLTGPVFDRLTMHVWCHPEKNATPGEPASVVAERVRKAREIQQNRQGKLNDELTAKEIANETTFRSEDRPTITKFAETLINRLGLSVRSYTRILKISRTIADLENSPVVLPSHLAEAASYRFLDHHEIQSVFQVYWKETN